ncbi:MAG TPA: class I SAM-dependent methyltransferase [Actinomycetota bacterium]|nr:class I SAM-dependent methyltransferase [Actinomycetota bacterium]
MTRAEHSAIVEEFTRTAELFDARTAARFDAMDVVGFSGLEPGGSILEAGSGTGNFLARFIGHAGTLIGVDLTPAMVAVAAKSHPEILSLVGSATHLPVRSAAMDLVACAQMLHHVWEPADVVREMRRATRPGGSVLIVDQVAPESFEAAQAMTALERLRDPSHAVSRPPSAYRLMAQSCGLEIVDERVHDQADSLSHWLAPEEFPEDRIGSVRDLIERHGGEMGMSFERHEDDWTFVRRRIMLLAKR